MALDVWRYAALSEYAYRRDSSDQELGLGEIAPGWIPFSLGANLDDKGIYAGDGFVINPSNGLTAYVLQSGGNFTIVFRGTDSASSFGVLEVLDILNDLNLDPLNLHEKWGSADNLVDGHDWASNVAHGIGVYDDTNIFGINDGRDSQWQSARHLVEYVLNAAGGGTFQKSLLLDSP